MQESSRHVGGWKSRPMMGQTAQPGFGREWRDIKGSQIGENLGEDSEERLS